jgi:hypothetical protein
MVVDRHNARQSVGQFTCKKEVKNMLCGFCAVKNSLIFSTFSLFLPIQKM